MRELTPLFFEQDVLKLLDQRYLPHEERLVQVKTIEECHAAIKDMVTRGAPLIGFTAIFGMALWVKANLRGTLSDFIKAGEYLNSARPTAVNLGYEINRVIAIAKKEGMSGLYDRLVSFGFAQIEISHNDNLSMAKFAEAELTKIYGKEKRLRLMTLCNTGRLACGPMGTALGVISYMNSLKRVEKVYASETRPYLQGARLTAFELSKEKIPHELVVEGSFSHLFKHRMVDAIFIGADRIVRNGDTANKIGSSTLAVVAKYYGVPFFVVAPTSSFDLSLKTGKEIEIELRNEEEILSYHGKRIAPYESRAFNPSFDVTDAENIAGIICEKGAITPATESQLVKIVEGKNG